MFFGFITSLFVSVIYANGLLNRIEWLSYDWRIQHYHQNEKLNSDIAVIYIDDASLNAMRVVAGRWPWPRSVHADLLEFLSMANPKAVLFDITFQEKQIVENQDPDKLNPHDLALVQASQSFPFAYHATRFLLDNSDSGQDARLNLPLPQDFVQRFSLQGRYGDPKNISDLVRGDLHAPNNKFYLPFQELALATNGIGVVEFASDDDGGYRRARLIHEYQNQYYPSLSTTALFDQFDPSLVTIEKHALIIDERRIPLDNEGKMLVKFYGDFTPYSYSGLMNSLQQIRQGDLDNLPVSPFEFENKIVFIGGSAAGLTDLKSTPLDSRLPGVMLHASIASNILDDDYLIPASTWLSYLLILVFSFITAYAILRIPRPSLKNAFPIVLGGGFLIWSTISFKYNMVYEIAAPLSAILMAWVLSFSSLLLIEGREKKRFKKMMSQYLSPAVLTTVVNNHEEFAKAEIGAKENITILFSDIRGFTNLSEKLPAEQVVEMLNYYFSKMTDAIFQHEGTIDKFIGDAIMAFWGAPIRVENHADQASLAAIEMIDKLKKVNAWLDEKSYPNIAIGVGIHTGEAILGNIGSENKLDYTIIGDNVNLASRMEGLTKPYGASILITENTYQLLTLDIPCLTVDLVRVKGKEQPIKVYQPLVNPISASSDQQETARQIAEVSAQAFQFYTSKKWDDAINLLDKIIDHEPARIIRQRCIDYKQSPPPENWDGVFTMTSK